MKIVLSNENPKPKNEVLSLVPTEVTPLTKENSIGLSLSTNPADDNAPKFKLQARILDGSEDVRSVLEWSKNLPRIFEGLNLNGNGDGPNQVNMIRNLLAGTARTLFDTELTTAQTAERTCRADAANAGARAAIRNQDVDHDDNTSPEVVRTAYRAMIRNILPRKILARVKRSLRREMRKPKDMKIRTYLQHIRRINSTEIPLLPPNYNAAQSLGNDELIDIVLFGTPNTWQKEMDRQGFDPMDSTLPQVVDFMERIELSEDFDGTNPTKVGKSKDKSKGKGNQKSTTSSNGGGRKYCMYHGMCNHDTEDCTVIKSLAKAKKAKTETPNGHANHSNKTWKRNGENGSKSSQKELAAFIQKAVKKGVQKELSSNKRKASEELDLNALEEELGLKDFNCAELEWLA